MSDVMAQENWIEEVGWDLEEERLMERNSTARSRHSRRSSSGSDTRTEFDGDADFASRRAWNRDQEELGDLDESLLNEDERSLRSARRRADRKVELTRAAVRAGLITLPLLVFLPFAGFIALLYFGVSLGRRAFKLFYEPTLRERFLQEEVQRQVVTRVRTERQNLEGAHHRSLEQLSASIAHEIRNPITAAKSLIQQMSENPDGDDQEEYARVAVSELERVERSITHLLRFAREEESHVESIEMRDVVESAIETFRDRCARGGFEISRRFDVPGHLEGDPEQLRRVVINLLSNAFDAIESASQVDPIIGVSMGENLAGTEIWLRIHDNGLGMDEETRSRVFDPFFTSRREGTGLGLALCQKIVDEHEGRIEVDSRPGEGTEFLVILPKEGRA